MQQIAMIPGIPQAASESVLPLPGKVIALAISSLCLASCASKDDYAPKTEAELDQQAQENRVFYQGWRKPEVTKEDRDFYHRFWGTN